MPDDPHPSGNDRYAIYAVEPRRGPGRRVIRRLCETSREGVMQAVEAMLEEDEVPRGWRVGVFDRASRGWPINPFA